MSAIKVVLLGDTGVGKTCIANRFAFNKYDDQDLPSKNATFVTKNLDVPQLGKSVRFQIWDTAGQERYHSMATMYYQNAEAAILVYDLTKPASFAGLKVWANELKEKGPGNIYKVIVGNKLDIADNPTIDENEVSEYAESNNAVSMSVSAKMDVNIKKIFEHIALKMNKYTEVKKDSEGVTLKGTTDKTKKDGCC